MQQLQLQYFENIHTLIKSLIYSGAHTNIQLIFI